MKNITMSVFSDLAQDFVEATSSLVRGRTINLMDTKGMIIASTEHGRIGDFHQGAKEAIETGRPVRIAKADLPKYKGAKEGYNMPIFQNGQVIGVVGVYGQEEEVQDVANLLRVYVTQSFKQQVIARRQVMEGELRSQLLDLYLLGNPDSQENIEQLSDVLSCHLCFPVTVIVLKTTAPSGISGIYDILRQYFGNDEVFSRNDIYGAKDNIFILIRSFTGSKRPDHFEDIAANLCRGKNELRMVISDSCANAGEIVEGYKEAKALLSLSGDGIDRLSEARAKSKLYLGKLLQHGGSHYIQQLNRTLRNEVSAQQEQTLLENAKTYFLMDGSVSQAAQALQIHRNTLLYRLNRLYEILGLNDVAPFERELFIRMLIAFRAEEG